MTVWMKGQPWRAHSIRYQGTAIAAYTTMGPSTGIARPAGTVEASGSRRAAARIRPRSRKAGAASAQRGGHAGGAGRPGGGRDQPPAQEVGSVDTREAEDRRPDAGREFAETEQP